MKALTKIGTVLGISQAAKAARTAAQHRGVLEQAQAKLAEAVRERSDLLAKRNTVVLDGEDADDYFARVRRAEQNISLLQDAVEEAGRRYSMAVESERILKLEDDTKAASELAIAGHEKGLQTMHAGLAMFLEGAALTRANREAIENINFTARAGGRHDLQIDEVALRTKIADALRPVADKAPPPRRLPDESDSAYALRVLNAASRADDEAINTDPLLVIEQKVIAALLNDLNPREPMELHKRMQTLISRLTPLVPGLLKAGPARKPDASQVYLADLDAA